MKKLLLLLLLMPLFVDHANAQGWQWAVGSHANDTTVITFSHIAVDAHGNVYESGIVDPGPGAFINTYGSLAIYDSGHFVQGILVSTDSLGNYRWALGTQGADVTFSAIAADTYDNIYVLGECTGPFTFGSYTYSYSAGDFCVKINSSGVVQWIRYLGGSLYSHLNAIICTGNSGNVYIAGSFLGSINIGSTTLVNSNSSGTFYDEFYALFDSSFTFIWAKSFGTLGTKGGCSGIAVTNNNELFLTGTYYSKTMIIGSDTLTLYSNRQQRLRIEYGNNHYRAYVAFCLVHKRHDRVLWRQYSSNGNCNGWHSAIYRHRYVY